jgi:hypothetical protein
MVAPLTPVLNPGGVTPFVVTPPAGPGPGFAKRDQKKQTALEAATEIATLIDSWTRTGVVVPASGFPIPWG